MSPRQRKRSRLNFERLESKQLLANTAANEFMPIEIGRGVSVDVHVAGDGSGAVTWMDGSENIYHQRFDPFQRLLGTAHLIANGDHYSRPRIAGSPNGETVVVYERELSTSGIDVLFTNFDRNGNALAVGRVNSNLANDQTEPSVGMADDGSFVVSYTHEYSSSDNDIYYRRFDASGTPLGESEPVDGATSSSDEERSAIAVGPDGSFVIAFDDDAGDGDLVYFSLYDLDGIPIRSNVRVPTERVNTHHQRFADVGMDANNNFVIAWQTNRDPGLFSDATVETAFRRFDANGNPLGDQVNVDTFERQVSANRTFIDPLGDARFPQLAVARDGEFVIAASESGSSRRDLIIHEYTAGGTFDANHRVSSFAYHGASGIARNADSYVLVNGKAASITNVQDLQMRTYWLDDESVERGPQVGSFAQNGEIFVTRAEIGGLAGTPYGARSTLVDEFNPRVNWQDPIMGDFDGDGDQTMMARTPSGAWWHTDGFDTTRFSVWGAQAGWHFVHAADFDGDGDDDVIGRTSGGGWWVGESDGSQLVNRNWGAWTPRVTWSDVQVADFNGDGRADVVGRAPNGQWWLARSTGSEFVNERWGAWSNRIEWTDVRTGDFDNDGRVDLMGRAANGDWWWARSNGSQFNNVKWGNWNPNANWMDVVVGDFNGDGRDDLAGRLPSGVWWVAQSNGQTSVNRQFGGWSGRQQWGDVVVGDFNRDGRDDIIGRALQSGDLWVGFSNGNLIRTYAFANFDRTMTWRAVNSGLFI